MACEQCKELERANAELRERIRTLEVELASSRQEASKVPDLEGKVHSCEERIEDLEMHIAEMNERD